MGEPPGTSTAPRPSSGRTEPGPSLRPAAHRRRPPIRSNEFRTPSRPAQLNAYHPRSLSYFTPPPLAMSVVGELLAQVTQQGVDVWHAGPLAHSSRKRSSDGCATWSATTGRLRAADLGRGDGQLPRDGAGPRRAAPAIRGLPARRAAAARRRADLHVRPDPLLDCAGARRAGLPPDTLVVLPTDDRFRLHPEPFAEAIALDRAAGHTPVAISAVAGSTNTGSVDLIERLAAWPSQGLWLHVDAAYGAAARLSVRDRGRVAGLELAGLRHRRSPQVVLPGL